MEIKFDLHAGQWPVWTSETRWRVLVAGRRFGKTILAVHELLRKALSRPKAKCWYTAPYYAQAKSICWQLMQDIIPKEIILKKNESELWLELINGSVIFLKGCDNEDSLVGVGLDFIVPDEAALYKPHVWPKILRPMLTDTKGGALFIGTPRGKNWLWELWMKGQRKDPGWESWQFPTAINPYIDPAEIEEARQTLPARVFAQEYEASFEDYVGLIYPEYNERIHVISPHKLDPRLEHIGAIDTAITGVTGALKATVDTDGSLIIYSEYYEENKRVNEVIPEIREDDITWYIDPAAIGQKVQRQGKIFTLFDEYVDNGIFPLHAEKSVEGGINRVGEAFKSHKIKIFSTCVNLIWELERYHWAETKETIKGVVKAAPYKKNDHLCDCLRYLVMGRESTRPEEKKKKPGLWSPAWDWPQYGGTPKQPRFV